MRHAYADPIAQAAIDRLEARLERVEKTAREANAVAIAEMNKCDRLEAKVERLSSLVATYELDQQEDERIIAELRAKVAAVEALAHELVSNGSGNSLADRLERQIGMRLHRALRTKP